MTRKLLDTTFLIHYLAGSPGVAAYLDDHEETSEFVTTAINLKELAVGLELQGKLDRSDVGATFDWIEIVPFESEHAFRAGRLEADLRRDGSHNQDKLNSLAADLLIAGVAKEMDIPIVTRNTDDFELFDGVTVESY